MKNTGPFESLHIRNFRFFLMGTVLSNASQWIQQVTLGWIVYDLTGSGTMLGSMNLVRSVAALGVIPLSGLLLERTDRRKLMVITNGWLFVITASMGFILITHHSQIAFLFMFAFLAGLAQTVDMNLRQIMAFNLVPRSATPSALAMVQTGWGLMRSFGPGIGGFLILWFGPGGNFLIQAGAYALIALNILQIQFPKRNVETIQGSPLQNIKDGIRYVANQKITRSFMALGLVLPFCIVPIFVVLPPIYAETVFHGGPETLGLLLAATGVGGIAGGVVTAFLSRFERRGLTQIASLFLLGLALTGFAFSTSLWVALPLMALAGFFEVIFVATNMTLIQLSIPENLRGRVTSVVNINGALSPLGGLIAGIGSDLLGGPKMITIAMCSLAAVIALWVLIASPTVREYRLSRAIASDTKNPTAG
jgi:predicted MFS family arabinose efflux permease